MRGRGEMRGGKEVAYDYEVLRGDECSGTGCIEVEEWLIGYGAIGASSMAEVVE